MIVPVLRSAALLCVLAAPGAGQVVEDRASSRPEARSPDAGGERRCAADGAVCISAASYAADVCQVIELAAETEGLDVGFFARLLWQESLFDPGAVSPAGAEGIAQFMPGTAVLRGLDDPFNPAEAILASADYLKELEERFGNLGLAAAAYNAGEARVERYLAGSSRLPGETRAYVLTITDYPAEVWREGVALEPILSPDGPPAPLLDPDPEPSFQDTCLARAERREAPTFGRRLRPWAVTIAGRESREAAEQEARRLSERYDALLGAERIDYTLEQFPGMQQPRHFGQVGRDTRVEAEALCERLRAAGAGCAVRRN